MRVVLATDDALTLAGLHAALADEQLLTVVGEASNGCEAVSLVQRLQPDLAIVDVALPQLDGIEATRLVCQSSPTTEVLILSTFNDADLLISAIRAGAAGFVLKTSSLADLRAAVWGALRRELPVEKSLLLEVLHRLADGPMLLPARRPVSRSPSPGDGVEHLSARELEVLALLASGKTNHQIADALVVTPHTVKTHVEHILAKLGVRDRTTAAVRALELGHVRRTPR